MVTLMRKPPTLWSLDAVRRAFSFFALAGLALLFAPAACSSKTASSFGGGTGSSGGSGGSGSGGSSGSIIGDGGGSGSSSGGGPVVCPSGLECNVSCSGGSMTTISGKVYDPALKNGLYDIAVYVPAAPLQALPSGVPTGADACSCAA